jgi:hypothetical protein
MPATGPPPPSNPPRPPNPSHPAAFHFGAGHIIVHGNPAFIETFGTEVIGQPAREALLNLPPKAFELMDLVFATGKPAACRVMTPAGAMRLVVAARRDVETDETYGVTTHLRPLPV